MEHKKLILIIIIGIFLATFVNAYKFDYYPEKGNLGSYDIFKSGIFGIGKGDKLISVTLDSNTEECSSNCLSEQSFQLFEKKSLIDEIKFFRKINGKWIEWKSFTNWDILVKKDGFDWEKLEIGKEYDIGNYSVKLIGSKKSNVIYDWQFKFGDVWTKDWAVWGNISEGDDAEVILNYPTNDLSIYNFPIGFNISGNITTSAKIVNVSIFTNDSGSWGKLGESFGDYLYLFDNFNDNSLDLSLWSNSTSDTCDAGDCTKYVYEQNSRIEQRAGASGTYGPSAAHSGTTSSQIIQKADVNSYNWTISYLAVTSSVGACDSCYGQGRYQIKVGSTVIIDKASCSNGGSSTYCSSSTYPATYNDLTIGSYILNKTNNTYWSLYQNGSFLRYFTGLTGNLSFYAHSRYYTGSGSASCNAQSYFDNSYINDFEQGEIINLDTSNHGEILWNALMCDSDGDCGFAPSNYTFWIDTNAPTINIESPKTLQNYGSLSQNETLNFTVTDSDNLDSCWYEYNETNHTIACSSGVKVSTDFELEEGDYSLIVWANDTLGNTNSESINWNYQFLELDRIYNENSVQTATEDFVLELQKGTGIISSSANLTYNGGTYSSTRDTSGYDVEFSNSISIPTSLSGSIPFYWTISFTNSTGTFYFNTSSSTQEIYNLSLTECFAPSLDGLTLNFTTYDLKNLTELNSTMEATFQFYAESGEGDLIIEYLFSDLNENRSNYMYCLESAGQNVTVDAFLSYGATDHDSRQYIIDDGIIGNFTQDIPLYLTETDLTDIVTITVQDQNYDPISGALVAIQKWNIGTNTYSTIGMFTTSSSGQGIIDLELYTTWYRAVVYVDGEIVKVTDVQKLSSTSWTIGVEIGVDNPYDIFGTISHGLIFDNETNITSFTWLDSSGYTSRGCLVIQNNTNTGPEVIFNSCVTSVSGTIDELISGDGSYTAYGILYLEGYNVSQIVDSLNIRLGTPEMIQTISPFGKVISFIAIGTAGMIGVAAGNAIIGGALVILVLIVLMYFGFLNITSGFIWGIISIIILVWITQRRKR